MRVTIDQSRCIGAGQCVLNAPDVFDQREDDGIVELLTSEPAGDSGDRAQLAARLCPAGAITIYQDA
jgi:ferredoxin